MTKSLPRGSLTIRQVLSCGLAVAIVGGAIEQFLNRFPEALLCAEVSRSSPPPPKPTLNPKP